VLELEDLNGRIGTLQLPSFEVEWPRLSEDKTVNTRERAIIAECDSNDLCILNGTSFDTASPGRLTSWQPGGQSTINYALASRNLMPLVKSFHVETKSHRAGEQCGDDMRRVG
jgi:hypothetical protein